MKKKTKKKINKKYRKSKKRKIRKRAKRIVIAQKKKKIKKINKKYRKSSKIKKIKIIKKFNRIKIKLKKIKFFKINKQISQIKKLNFKKLIDLFFKPVIRTYNDLREKRKMKRLQQINLERKEREREIKEREKIRKQIKERELRDEIKIAKQRSKDLKNFLKKEQALIRIEQKEKERKFLEELKLEKKLESFRKRELQEIKNLEKIVLKEQREDYRPLQDRLEGIKEKYRLIREQKIRERVQSLGLEISDSDTKEDLLKREKEYAQYRQQIELVLESFYRSANSLIFQLNKRYIPKHKSILRVIDRRYETNECFIRYDDSPDEDWLILIYLEDSDPKKGKIIVENKSNPEKHESKSFHTKDIFIFSDYLVDAMTAHIDMERQKKIN